MESKSADLGSLKCKLERRISIINSELLAMSHVEDGTFVDNIKIYYRAMLDEYIPVDDFIGYIRGVEAAVDTLYGEES
jgi:hypothetical protein|nr:MAG TPA: Papain inhibitor autolysis-inducing protein [Caudoviricetes sp.]